MSTKYPQGIITPTPPYKSTTAKSFSGVWTLEQLANNFYYYRQAVQKSLRFRSSASAYLSRTPSVAGNRQTWTWSGWVKRGTLSLYRSVFGGYSGTSNGSLRTTIVFNANDQIDISSEQMQVAGDFQITTNAVYRDPSAWYHIVVAVDTTQATSTNRVKLYINGVQVTSFATSNYPSQNYQGGVNATSNQYLARYYDSGAPTNTYFDGYMAEVNFIDGQALDPSYFGQISPITGVWSPAPYVGSYGTNGFYLKFTDTTSTTTLCYDYSGNNNNWTPNNISLTAGSTYDSMLDSPTNYDNGGNGVGNYAVLNPINTNVPTISAGNLSVTGPDNTAMATIGMPSGKWYFETTVITVGPISAIGMCATQPTATNYPGYLSDGYCYISNGNKQNNNTSTAYGASYTNGDVIGVAFDADAGSLTFYKNGVSQGVAFSSIPAKTYYFAVYGRSAGGTNNCAANFGQRPFAYTPPTGYKALNTQNLPAPSIQNGANYMAATLYTGNGATQSIVNAVNGVSFQPDFVWGKLRTTSSYHRLSDSVRGASLTLATNVTDAEVSGNGLVSFDAAGFSMNSSTNINQVYPYVAWQWKAGGTAVTNTAGSITSSVSANTTSGFSVVTYTGTGSNATVGHGLGVAPSMIINKSRNAAQNWTVFHAGLANMTTAYVRLNTTDAAGTLGNAVATPTSTTFGISASTADTSTYVAYCFAAIPGYSAFGSYTGNGSADGPFVYCGFRPRYVMVKKTSSSNGDWPIMDTSRGMYNAVAPELYADLSQQETNSSFFDILSNGFKARATGQQVNANGDTYIYAAFAENPFNYSLAR